MKRKLLWITLFILSLQGCTTLPPGPSSIRLPLVAGWFEGQKVYYITTDVSDQALARKLNANYAPRLKASLLPRHRPRTIKSVVERVYVFPGKEQGSVLPSSPTPLGSASTDTNYSPIWQIYEVHWQVEPMGPLTSEEAVLDAEEKGKVRIRPTPLVVNCPVVMTENETLGLDPATSKSTDTEGKGGY